MQISSTGLLLTLLVITSHSQAADSVTERLKQQFKRPVNIPFPADNPYNAEKAQLGKMLFFDQRLSRNFNMNCATCHNPSLGWEDGVPGAFGGQGETLKRHSPTTLNLAWGNSFFWDGRAPSLEEQIRGPVESAAEMNIPLSTVAQRLNKVEGYRNWFARVFPGDGIQEDGILKAIATYERTLVSGTAPFDRWVEGEENALSVSAKRGFTLFNGKAACSQCHGGWNFTDNQFHDIGLPSDDTGRMAITGAEQDRHRFKTPGLRNISQRAPYMHDGSLSTLEQVIVHYVVGGIARPGRSDKIIPTPLNEGDIRDLTAFLNSLTGADQPVSLPILPY